MGEKSINRKKVFWLWFFVLFLHLLTLSRLPFFYKFICLTNRHIERRRVSLVLVFMDFNSLCLNVCMLCIIDEYKWVLINLQFCQYGGLVDVVDVMNGGDFVIMFWYDGGNDFDGIKSINEFTLLSIVFIIIYQEIRILLNNVICIDRSMYV